MQAIVVDDAVLRISALSGSNIRHSLPISQVSTSHQPRLSPLPLALCYCTVYSSSGSSSQDPAELASRSSMFKRLEGTLPKFRIRSAPLGRRSRSISKLLKKTLVCSLVMSLYNPPCLRAFAYIYSKPSIQQCLTSLRSTGATRRSLQALVVS